MQHTGLLLNVMMLIISAAALSADDVARFEYRPERIRTGTLYHYVKSNHDGSNPENIAVYVAARDRLEVFKYHEPGTRAGYVIATMDWALFSAVKLQSYQALSATEEKPVATLEFSKETKTITTRLLIADAPPEIVRIEWIPFHVYNFDFTSLNFAFRHLRDPKSSFGIDVPDLVSRNDQWRLENRGRATIRYAGEDTVRGQPCFKYEIGGKGLENRGGFLWFHAKEGHAEKMQIDLPDNPDWDNFLFVLKEIRNLSSDQWREFRQNHFAKLPPTQDPPSRNVSSSHPE